MSFKVAIYSYNRSKTIEKDTLDTILSMKIKAQQIHIFVANEEEKVKYENRIDKSKYNKIIVGKLGKMNQINFVRQYFNQGEKILNLDDDVVGIVYKYDNVYEPVSDLYSYSEMMFKLMKKYKTGLGGVFHAKQVNVGNTKNVMYIGFEPIYGPLYWTLNDKNKKLNLTSKTCEDLEFTIKCYRLYGKTIRSHEIRVWDKSYTLGKIESTMNKKQILKDHYNIVMNNQDLIKLKKITKEEIEFGYIHQSNDKEIHLKRRRL